MIVKLWATMDTEIKVPLLIRLYSSLHGSCTDFYCPSYSA